MHFTIWIVTIFKCKCRELLIDQYENYENTLYQKVWLYKGYMKFRNQRVVPIMKVKLQISKFKPLGATLLIESALLAGKYDGMEIFAVFLAARTIRLFCLGMSS